MAVYQHDEIVPFKNSPLSKKKQVEEMFNQIADKYDLLNRFLSFRIDVIWRKKAINTLKTLKPAKVLDVATGTGDLAIMTYNLLKPELITGIDISQGMINVGMSKIEKAGLQEHIRLEKGDSETINYATDSFDAVTVAFGVRNFENLEKGLTEMYRVLKPGGMAVILEFSKPKSIFLRLFYQFYMNFISPAFVKLFSRNVSAYNYLNHSVDKFPEGSTFLNILTKAGFINTSQKKLLPGICSIYCGKK